MHVEQRFGGEGGETGEAVDQPDRLAIQPAQVVSLKTIYASLRDGMSAPADWFEIDDEADGEAERRAGVAGSSARA